MDETLWIYNPYLLLNKYYLIIPTPQMTRIEQMNTSTRFLFYFLIICLIFDFRNEIIILILIGIVLIVIFYLIYKTDVKGIQNDLLSENKSNLEKFQKDDNNFDCDTCNQGLLNKPMINIYDSVKDKIFKGTGNFDKNIE